jgi:carbon-monoxide dehydrogenase medium subunit
VYTVFVKPGPFAYEAPAALENVLELLADDTREARLIAGGQSLVPMMNFRFASPEVLVDIGRVESLRQLDQSDSTLSISAGVRQSQLLRDPAIATKHPLLAEAVRHIGHPQIRSRGTVCGSLAHADPTAELPAVAVALNARMHIAGPDGDRVMAAEDFFLGYYTVALQPGEMLKQVVFPAQSPKAGWSFQELARRRGDFALAGVAVLLDPPGARVVLFGVDAKPYRARDVEQLLLDGRVDEVAPLIEEAVTPRSDVHASSEYRAELAGVLTKRAAAEAWNRCG